jgi:polar amino acid transport system permease protein
MKWDWNYTLEILPHLLQASLVTFQATVAGSAVALFSGALLLLLRRSSIMVISRSTAFFIEFMRSTPLLVQIYFLYYVFPGFGLTLSPLAAGILALGLHYGSYLSEVYRSGIESIPRGQWEAAKALDLTTWQTYRDIILPQAIPPVIPAAGNYIVAMFKETPQLSAITVLELMQVARITGSDNFRYLEPFTLVGILFLIMSYTAGKGIRIIEKKLPITGIPIKEDSL